MPPRKIIYRKKNYYYYDTYRTWAEAYRIIKEKKRRNGTDYYYIRREQNTLFGPTTVYDIYFNRIIALHRL